MFKNKRILFYVPGLDVIKGAVYYSQVFGLAQYLVQQGAHCLVVESAYGEGEYWEKEVDGVVLVNCPQMSKYVPQPFLHFKNRKMVKPAWQRMLDFRPTHIYVRNVYAGLAALNVVKASKAKLVFSRRGHEIAETFVNWNIKAFLKSRIVRLYTTYLMRHASHVSMVAGTLYDDTIRFCKYTSVLPCCVMEDKFNKITAEERDNCRRMLDIPLDAKVVIYSGSMGHYQIPQVFLSLMKRLYENDKTLRFVILTEMLDELNRNVESVGLPKDCYRVRKCMPQEVIVYLQSADVGLILRKDDAINHYASPVKIAEYLASGLGLIISPWIGDIGVALNGKDFAFLHRPDSSIETIIQFIYSITSEKRDNARAFARSYYTYDGNCDALKSMFA